MYAFGTLTKRIFQLVVNAVIEKNEMQINSSRFVKIKDRKDVTMEVLPKTESRFCFLANMYSSRGEPGKVMRNSSSTGTLFIKT